MVTLKPRRISYSLDAGRSGAASRPVRVAVVQEILAHYRVPIFQRLATTEGMELCVYYGAGMRGYPKRSVTNREGVPGKMVRNYYLRWGDLTLCFQPGVLRHLFLGKYDVIICGDSPWIVTNLLLLLYRKLRGAKLVAWGGTREPAVVTLPRRVFRYLGKAAKRHLYRHIDAFIAYGTWGARYFASMGVPGWKIFIAYNSIDTERAFRLKQQVSIEDRRTWGVLEGTSLGQSLSVLYVGALLREKKIDNLLAAYSRIVTGASASDPWLLIVGDGPERERLEALTAALRLDRVRFFGRLKDEDLARLMVVADVVVLPGHGGLAVQQALAFGKPVIVGEADGTEIDLVQDGVNGFRLQSGGSVDELACKLRCVLGDATLRRAMGNASTATVRERVNVDVMLQGFLGALRFVNQAG